MKLIAMNEVLDMLRGSSNASINITVGLDDLRQVAMDFARELAERMRPEESEPAEADPLMTIEEVAALLRVTPQTLWRWHKCGYLKRVYAGSKPRYRRSDIEKLSNQHLNNS